MFDRIDIEKRCIKIIRDVIGNEELDIQPQYSLIGDVGLDSVDFVSLLLALEDEFGGTIDDEISSQIFTVNDIINHIEQEKNEVVVE